MLKLSEHANDSQPDEKSIVSCVSLERIVALLIHCASFQIVLFYSGLEVLTGFMVQPKAAPNGRTLRD